MAQMAARGAKYAEGAFVGDGSNTISLNIGFKPDCVVIESNVDYTQAGWSGIGHVVIIKNIMTTVMRHNNNTVSTVLSHLTSLVGSGSEFGTAGETVQYGIYGEYSDDVSTLTIKDIANLEGTVFTSDRNYTWKAYAE